ncbi:MAG: SU10 major capsid protein [Sulfuriferula sp.]
MATYQTTTPAKGLRESLADFIENISAEDTPIYSMARKGKISATFEEWQTDVLAAANPNNAIVEGADATYATPVATTRLGNYVQTARKDFKIASVLDMVNKAGRSTETKYQSYKQGNELKTDIESALSQNNVAVAATTTVAGKSASLETFAWDVVSHGSTGATAVVTAGAPTTAITDGTQRALSEALVKAVLADGYGKGARYKMGVMGPTQKQAFSALSGLGSTRNNFSTMKGKQGVILGAADVYVSDFGDIALVPSQFMRNRTILFIDPEMLEVKMGRRFKEEELAKTGDAEGRQIISDFTLVVRNPRGIGKLADLS